MEAHVDWAALGSIAELAGASAVVLTLLYLAKQVKVSNRHDRLTAYQHSIECLNSWCVSAYGSPEIASLIIRGRHSYHDLNEVERFRFEHVHIHLINIIESHLYQANQTSMDDEDYRQWAITNLELIAQGYLGYPGTRELWSAFKEYVKPEARDLISRSIAPRQTT